MKFNKLLLLCFMLVCQETIALDSEACKSNDSYYTGIGYSFREIKFRNNVSDLSLQKKSNGPQLLVGYRHPSNFGAEMAVSTANKKSLPTGSVKSFHIHFDGVYFYPVTDYVEMLVGVGLGSSKLSYKSSKWNYKKNSVSPRGLIGSQVNLDDNIKLRISSSLESFAKIKKSGPYRYKSILSGNLGLLYSF